MNDEMRLDVEYKGFNIVRALGFIPKEIYENKLKHSLLDLQPGVMTYFLSDRDDSRTAVTRLPYERTADDARQGALHPENLDDDKIYVASAIDVIAKTFETAERVLGSRIKEFSFEYLPENPAGIPSNEKGMQVLLDDILRISEGSSKLFSLN